MLVAMLLLFVVTVIAIAVVWSRGSGTTVQQKTTEVIKAILPRRQHGRTPLMLGASAAVEPDDESSCMQSSSMIRVQ